MSEPDKNVSTSEEGEACIVCFKSVEIYSIGECNHPVCYECSTRMRVLCQQNECPICRHVLSKVIFTYEKLPYSELEAKNRSEYYSKKYKIGFYTREIQQAFFNLLDHPCPKCKTPPYRTFQGLRNHVRKEHDLYYCDLCAENLKIFTFERRCYTQAELGIHLIKGDSDNKSHRGHPLCEYCYKRFLDRDELFRHLRREHYFCHFCDADGCNEFYRDYEALAEHFRQDHFLCEEGKCATEQFVGAFRTEIDYKAHVANVHGKSLNKQQVKQTRTLQLEITLGPRGRSGQIDQGAANVRSRGGGGGGGGAGGGGNEDFYEELLEASTSNSAQQNKRSITIDSKNEQDFPSLAGTASGPSLSLARPPPQTYRNRSTTSGLARTKENFPALGGSSGNGGGGGGLISSSTPRTQTPNQQATPISSVLRQQPTSASGAVARTLTTTATTPINGNPSGMVIHVSNRPVVNSINGGVAGKKKSSLDFPALPAGKSKGNTRSLNEDMLPSPSAVPVSNVSAKNRALLDDYVSVANPSNFQKIKLVQKEDLEAKARKAAEQMNAPKLTSQDFPSLGDGSSKTSIASTSGSWMKTTSDKKQRELDNRKAKVAPPPSMLSKNNNKSTTQKLQANNKSVPLPLVETVTKKDKEIKEKKNKEKKPSTTDLTSQQNKSNSAKAKGKTNNNNNESKAMQGNSNDNSLSSTTAPLMNGDDSSISAAGLRPPPGFVSDENFVQPPPGFQSNVTLNSVAKSPNNLTFTTSLGENYSIIPAHKYIQPPDAVTRNQKLVGYFKEALKSPEALEEFRHISQKFREGVYKTQPYYEHCQAALRDKFDVIFPELLALLPDISKQQALYLVHTQRLNKMAPNQKSSLPKLEVCGQCKQIVRFGDDADSHRKTHELTDNFPVLGSNGSGRTAATTRK